MIYYALLQFVYYTNTFSSRGFTLCQEKLSFLFISFFLSDFLQLWPPIALRHPPTSNHQYSDPANSWDKIAVILCGSKGRCNPAHTHKHHTRRSLDKSWPEQTQNRAGMTSCKSAFEACGWVSLKSAGLTGWPTFRQSNLWNTSAS